MKVFDLCLFLVFEALKGRVFMVMESDKIMFEIYRDDRYGHTAYKVVYYTELDDHNKEKEINAAMAGEHFFDGFIKEYKKSEAKSIIARAIERLNNGETVDPEILRGELAPYI